MLQKITKALSGDPKKVRLADWEVIFTSVYNNIYCRVGKGIYISPLDFTYLWSGCPERLKKLLCSCDHKLLESSRVLAFFAQCFTSRRHSDCCNRARKAQMRESKIYRGDE